MTREIETGCLAETKSVVRRMAAGLPRRPFVGVPDVEGLILAIVIVLFSRRLARHPNDVRKEFRKALWPIIGRWAWSGILAEVATILDHPRTPPVPSHRRAIVAYLLAEAILGEFFGMRLAWIAAIQEEVADLRPDQLGRSAPLT